MYFIAAAILATLSTGVAAIWVMVASNLPSTICVRVAAEVSSN